MLLIVMIPAVSTADHTNPQPGTKTGAIVNDTGITDPPTDNTVHETTAEQPSVPSVFDVRQNYPNPFNAGTVIEYDLPTESGVYAVIYNTLGRKVRALENSIRSPGRHKLEWDGRNDAGDTVSSGVYFFVFMADENYTVQKMMLVK